MIVSAAALGSFRESALFSGALVTQVQDAELVYVVVVLGLQSHVPCCVHLDLKPVKQAAAFEDFS